MSLDNAFSSEDVIAWANRLAKVLEDEGAIAIPATTTAESEERAAPLFDLGYIAEVRLRRGRLMVVMT